MIKRLPIAIEPEPEESIFYNQYYGWLNDSHYWIENMIKDNIICKCKWCGMIQPNCLSNSKLCEENPEILRIKKTEKNA